jgi:hypothetical protein
MIENRQWAIVPIQDVPLVWNVIEPFLQKACELDFNKQCPDDFLNLILEDKAQLWVGRKEDEIEASAITDIIQFTNKKYARVTIGMGQDPKHLDSFIATFEEWAKSLGCDGAQSEMRVGFLKEFKNQGWKMTHVLMEKEL